MLLLLHGVKESKCVTRIFTCLNVALQCSRRIFQVYVSGLAEGKSSVLKGGIIKCIWKARQYSGRVHSIEQLCINMELHLTFHRLFNVNIDRIEHVRFIFTRTPFRTSHVGIGMAPQHML